MQYTHLGTYPGGRKRCPSQVQTVGEDKGATPCLTGVTFSQNQHGCYLRDGQRTLTTVARRPDNSTSHSHLAYHS